MNAQDLLKRLRYWQNTFRVLPPGAEAELNSIVAELEVEASKVAQPKNPQAAKKPAKKKVAKKKK